MAPWRHRRSSFHRVLAGGEVEGKAFQVVGTVRVKQGTGARAGMLGKGRAGAWGGRQRRQLERQGKEISILPVG